MSKDFALKHEDDSWVHDLAASNLERDWYIYTDNKFENITDKYVEEFNLTHGYNLELNLAKQLVKKKFRYIIGAFQVMAKGEKDKNIWIEFAKKHEEKFRSVEERMKNWYLSKNGEPQLVTAKEQIQFYHGRHSFLILEKIPDLFTDYECKYIKPCTELEVFGYDSQEGYIDLDFTADVRKRIFGTEVRRIEDSYAILIKNTELNRLESIENLC